MNRHAAFVLGAISLLAVAMVISLSLGPVSISLSEVLAFLTNSETDGLSETKRTILWNLRLPRILAATCVGASLGVAGVGLQGLFRNSLADPFIIGASSGASLGVTLFVVMGVNIGVFGSLGMSAMALIGSVAAVTIVYSIAAAGRNRVSPASLLLAGVALTSVINAAVSLLMFMRSERVLVIFSWLMGSFSGTQWSDVIVTFGSASIGIGAMWLLSRPLDAMLLGESVAESLGLDTARYRLLVVVAASIGTGVAVAAAGIIGFVGLVAPHMGRIFVGARHVWLTPISAVVGALMLVVADTMSRTIVAPAELPVGILTALCGGPFFLFLLKSQGALEGTR